MAYNSHKGRSDSLIAVRVRPRLQKKYHPQLENYQQSSKNSIAMIRNKRTCTTNARVVETVLPQRSTLRTSQYNELPTSPALR